MFNKVKSGLKKIPFYISLPLTIVLIALVSTGVVLLATAVFGSSGGTQICVQDKALTAQGFDLCSMLVKPLSKSVYFMPGTNYPQATMVDGVQVFNLWSYDQQVSYMGNTPVIVQKIFGLGPMFVYLLGIITIPFLFIVFKLMKWIHKKWGIRNSIRTVFRKVSSLKKSPQPVN
jgi:hypothetical protein